MKFASIYKLTIASLLSASLVIGCTKQDDNNGEEAAKIRAQKVRLNKLTAELEQTKKDIDLQKMNAEETNKWLNAEKSEWEKNRQSRELQLVDLTQKLSDEKAQLEKTKEAYQAISTKLTTEKASLESAIKSLGEEKIKTEQEIAKLTADSKAAIASDKKKSDEEIAKINADTQAKATETQIKLAAANSKLAELDKQQAQLEKEQARVKDLDASLLALKENLEKMSADLAAREAKFQTDIATTREFFAKEGLGDALASVEGDSVIPFLISVIGTGKPEFRKMMADKIIAINESGKVHSKIAKPTVLSIKVEIKETKDSYEVETPAVKTKETNPNIVTADDQFVIHARVSKVRELRNTLNQLMTDENNKGVATEETSLFVIARPVQKVRTSMVMMLFGTEGSTPDSRDSKMFAKFDFPTAESSLVGLSSINLANPGTYAFGNEINKACSTVEIECLKALLKLGVLEDRQVVTEKSNVVTSRGTTSQNSSTAYTYRQLLQVALKASVDQLEEDRAGLMPIGLKIDPTKGLFDGGFDPDFDFDSAKKGLFGLGRAKIIDDIQIRYVIKMVDSVNTTGNYFDTFKYMFSGFIDGFGILSERKSRNEIEIELPIELNELKASRANFPDLSMSDWKFAKAAPIPPKNDTSTWYSDSPAKNKYDADLEAWTVERDAARNEAFKSRLFETAGMQFYLLKQLK